ncbi:MAG: TIGR03067 domain-containing protein, partial [Planctomycetes bacterium]|nr:TIGR03067 domain-containing protein [Planctomycetota bacterium]
ATVLAVVLVITGLGVGHVLLPVRAAEPRKEPQTNEKPPAPKTDAADQEKKFKNDLDQLQGTWRLVRSESDGLTFDEDRPEVKDTRLVIDKSSVTMIGKVIHDPRIHKEPEDVKAVGTVTLDAEKNPKQIVFTWESNPLLSKEYLTQRGIYALEGDSLKLCLYFPGSDTKLLIPTELSAHAGSKRSLGTWRRVAPAEKGREKKSREGDNQPTAHRLGDIKPPGGVPLVPGRSGTPLTVDMMTKVRKRLESAPAKDLDQWVVELERIMGQRLEGALAKQACRTYFVTRMSVAFDDLKWNARAADKLFQCAQTMPPPEVKIWKEAFESLLKKEIGQTATEVLDGGPEYAVPLALIPVDSLHEGPKYSAERGQKYLARLKQLTAADVSLWRDEVDQFGGTELDAAVNIILLDDYFDQEKFRRDKFKAAVEQQQEKKVPARETREKEKLQGGWRLVSLELDGLRVGEGRPELKDTRLLIQQNTLTLSAPETALAGLGTKKAVAKFRLDTEHAPKEIVLTWKECPWNGQEDFTQKALYAVDGDNLRICLSRRDEDKEAPREFAAPTGSERLLWNFQRDPASEKRGEK